MPADTTYKCSNCGGLVSPHKEKCGYCGAWLRQEGHHEQMSLTPRAINVMTNLPKGVGEFGFSSKRTLAVCFLYVLGLYGLGWKYEDTRYWLDSRAMTIWVGLLPLCLFLLSVSLRGNRFTIIPGIALSVTITFFHLSVVFLVRGSINDDMLGISLIVGGGVIMAWLAGRLVHRIVRYRRVK